jgi:hypothetical protein
MKLLKPYTRSNQYLLLRTKSISASLSLLNELLKFISLSTLDTAISAANLDLLRAFSVSILERAISVSILDLRRALSTAKSEASLDLLKANSVSR